jgi:hypothetical protein
MTRESKDHESRNGLSLAPLTLEEAVGALLKVKPDPPRKRRHKTPEKPDADEAKDD